MGRGTVFWLGVSALKHNSRTGKVPTPPSASEGFGDGIWLLTVRICDSWCLWTWRSLDCGTNSKQNGHCEPVGSGRSLPTGWTLSNVVQDLEPVLVLVYILTCWWVAAVKCYRKCCLTACTLDSLFCKFQRQEVWQAISFINFILQESENLIRQWS